LAEPGSARSGQHRKRRKSAGQFRIELDLILLQTSRFDLHLSSKRAKSALGMYFYDHPQPSFHNSLFRFQTAALHCFMEQLIINFDIHPHQQPPVIKNGTLVKQHGENFDSTQYVPKLLGESTSRQKLSWA
jgi:hypothetical protein